MRQRSERTRHGGYRGRRRRCGHGPVTTVLYRRRQRLCSEPLKESKNIAKIDDTRRVSEEQMQKEVLAGNVVVKLHTFLCYSQELTNIFICIFSYLGSLVINMNVFFHVI